MRVWSGVGVGQGRKLGTAGTAGKLQDRRAAPTLRSTQKHAAVANACTNLTREWWVAMPWVSSPPSPPPAPPPPAAAPTAVQAAAPPAPPPPPCSAEGGGALTAEAAPRSRRVARRRMACSLAIAASCCEASSSGEERGGGRERECLRVHQEGAGRHWEGSNTALNPPTPPTPPTHLRLVACHSCGLRFTVGRCPMRRRRGCCPRRARRKRWLGAAAAWC